MLSDVIINCVLMPVRVHDVMEFRQRWTHERCHINDGMQTVNGIVKWFQTRIMDAGLTEIGKIVNRENFTANTEIPVDKLIQLRLSEDKDEISGTN